jgi:outer membrane protein assembly factor BamB
VLIALVSLLLVGCVSRNDSVTWPAVGVVTLPGDQPRSGTFISVANSGYIVLVDPIRGVPVQLLDSDGEPRFRETTPVTWDLDGGEMESRFFSAPILLPGEGTTERELLIVDYNNRLFLVDYAAARVTNPTGIEIPGHVLTNVAVADGIAYVPFSEADVAAVDINSGEVLWRFDTERGVWAAPMVVDDIVIFGSIDHRIYAVNRATGVEVWNYDTGASVSSTPLYADGYLYIGSFNHEIYQIDINTGEVVSQFETEGWVWSTPVLVDDVLYATDLRGNVYALDVTNDLREIWSNKVDSSGIRPSVIVAGSYVIAAARSGKIYWLNRSDGEQVQFNDAPLSLDVDREILSEMVLLEPSENLDIPGPMLIVSTTSSSKVLVAFPLDSDYLPDLTLTGWTYGR